MNDFFQTLFGWLSSMYEQGWDNFLSVSFPEKS